jgi:hypothetical protein
MRVVAPPRLSLGGVPVCVSRAVGWWCCSSMAAGVQASAPALTEKLELWFSCSDLPNLDTFSKTGACRRGGLLGGDVR